MSEFLVGDEVLANGSGLGELVDGGYSQLVNVTPKMLVRKPKGLSLRECMILGTAGFTAALCVHRMMVNGQTPEKGPILVTGSTGGVGSFSVNICNKLGFSVIAMTSKKDKVEYLKKLGADEVVSFESLGVKQTPLGKAKFGGVIDNLGGEVLSSLIPYVNLWGNVASVGLASGPGLSSTVMPFILRGVSLLGISSNNCEIELKRSLWNRLSTDLKPNLDFVREVGLKDLSSVFEDMLANRSWGRTVVKI